MDVLTHTLSGIAAATVILSFTEEKTIKSLKILGFGALGGTFPDIDAISMWSRFDATFGRLFGLSHTGREIYGEKFWYSHHAFFHSIAAALLIVALLIFVGYLFSKIKKKSARISLIEFCKRNIFLYIAFVVGYLLHLFGDMSTPSSVWGGVNMFFPADAYIGGSGKIWWWNNYDIFLLIVLCIVANCVAIFFRKRYIRLIAPCIALLTFVLIIVQINTRQYDYAYNGNTTKFAEMEQQSKQEQERILGKRVYKFMKWFDDHLPIPF
jgi:Predicted membrane-bound metal-dependent hydrolase (DUF457).